ncbi:acetyl-CoA synthetase-like protein [Heliocybe sulcata]|uniref:Acetyl-CoA synthetase-like protein n=1 Tax=Heliocybe sulcata TaxID=5364 RepID=A0A5C3N3Z9_9AGAM|nr:acetyl-CoA synthetase-like protein [Heliocybe sulcata]
MLLAEDLSYLTCTGGQAKLLNDKNPHGFVSLNQVLQERARTHSDVLLAGFPERKAREHDPASNGSDWEVEEFTFASFLQASNAVAAELVRAGTLRARQVQDGLQTRIVALLSPSCAEFLVFTFAAIRLGYGVLLIAPQNSAEAIRHLCLSTKCAHLFCHSVYMQLGINAFPDAQDDTMSGNLNVQAICIPPRAIWETFSPDLPILDPVLSPSEEKDAIALVFHTSGSTGMPKPIYHTHSVWTQGLPCLPGDAAFTTTPLYHGGLPDFLRGMMSLTPLYLYPSLHPVTASNVVSAVAACPDVCAFLSVPYILKMLSESDAGMSMLQSMRLVSTGGAPLPEETGDEMVKKGIRLVSRLGSSECGFLMSSARDYVTDKSWSWLRDYSHSLGLLRFVPAGETGSYELIVDKTFSTLTTSNRPDGSFATGDLYAKHPTIPHAWRYAGRADDIIVMTNGKKTSASVIENSLRASPIISEALVFGTSRPALGVLILTADANITREHVLAVIHAVNSRSPSYAHIVDEMGIILPSDATFPKASKGTLLRPLAYQQYAEIIEQAYQALESGGVADPHLSHPSGEALVSYVRNVVQSAIPECVSLWADDDDLLVLGVTSVTAIGIRSKLQKELLQLVDRPLPSNFVYENPSVKRLVRTIESIRRGEDAKPSDDVFEVMRDLVAKYGAFNEALHPQQPVSSAERVIVLSGATGALGAHILARFLSDGHSEVVLLVRAKDDVEAEQRVMRSLERRGLGSVTSRPEWAKVKCLAVRLGDSNLGLAPDVYDTLTGSVTNIVHAAWDVNFVANFDSFAPVHLAGLRGLIDLAIASRRRASLVFCSSTAAVVNDYTGQQPIPESLPQSENSPSSLGYSRSKWVAEHICARAHSGPLNGRISLARIGQLCGDTQHGIWNEAEAWPLLIASMKYTGCLPSLDEHPSWFPVDAAAKVICDIVRVPNELGTVAPIPVYHVLNSNMETSWADILQHLAASGLNFATVSPQQWLSQLEDALLKEDDARTRAMLELWHTTYADETKKPKSQPVYDTYAAASVSKTMKDPSPISADLVGKFLDSWRKTGFLPPARADGVARK